MGVPRQTSTKAAKAPGRKLAALGRNLLAVLVVAIILGGSWLLYTDGVGPMVDRFSAKYLDWNGDGISGAARCP